MTKALTAYCSGGFKAEARTIQSKRKKKNTNVIAAVAKRQNMTHEYRWKRKRKVNTVNICNLYFFDM